MKIVLPYPPSLNKMYRTVNGRMLISAVGREYKNEVYAFCLVHRIKPISGDLAISLDCYRPAKRGDLDNLFKGLFDALNGCAWHDDSQVIEINARRFDDAKNPRVEVEIQARSPKP